MAESGARDPAGALTSVLNVDRIMRERPGGYRAKDLREGYDITDRLRQELQEKGLKGFKRGGRVKKSGVAKVHKGERVLTVKQAKKPAVKKALHNPSSRSIKAPARTSSKPKNGKVRQVMHEFKTGTLHSGSKKGPKVKSRRQAIAIALSQARKGKR